MRSINELPLTIMLISAISERPRAGMRKDIKTRVIYTMYIVQIRRLEYLIIFAAKLYQKPVRMSTPVKARKVDNTSNVSPDCPSKTNDIEHPAITM